MGKKDKAMVLLSGGPYSAVGLFWAKREFKDVNAIHFGPEGQELDDCRLLCEMTDTDLTEIDYVSEGKLRILLLLGHTVNASIEEGFTHYVLGCNPKVKPNHWPHFLTTVSAAIAMSKGGGMKVTFHAPFEDMSREEMGKMATELDCLEIVRNLSR